MKNLIVLTLAAIMILPAFAEKEIVLGANAEGESQSMIIDDGGNLKMAPPSAPSRGNVKNPAPDSSMMEPNPGMLQGGGMANPPTDAGQEVPGTADVYPPDPSAPAPSQAEPPVAEHVQEGQVPAENGLPQLQEAKPPAPTVKPSSPGYSQADPNTVKPADSSAPEKLVMMPSDGPPDVG